jgi:integrase
MQVLLIMRISGAMRREELTKMTIDNIQEKEDLIIVEVPDTKTKIDRRFVISNVEFIKYYRKYAALRPLNTETRRFFINYQKGKCIKQPVGINKIGETPSLIAKFLQLADIKAYTGHSFRRTSATLLVDARGDITNLKRHGGWKTSSIAEGYIADSTENKIKLANLISSNEISNQVPSEQVQLRPLKTHTL